MPESPTSGTPQRRVGVYERLGRAGGSPGKMIGIAVVLLMAVPRRAGGGDRHWRSGAPLEQAQLQSRGGRYVVA